MPKRKDGNQTEIAEALRKAGATVTLTHTLGKGFPDLVAGFRGINYLIEIKDGSKPPSKRKLTPDEIKWHELWRGQVDIANSVEEALRIIGVNGVTYDTY